jgi:sec-independent protein translocase protein TatA
MTGLESPSHLLIVLIVAVLVFGPKRLPEVGRSLGAGIRGFRESIAAPTEHHDDEK